MTERLATTPFGGAPLRAEIFARQNRLAQRQEALRQNGGGNDNGVAEKWQLIRALTEARELYGLSDRSITVLEALVSFHQERQLDGREAIIVFPSNAELALRCRGMSPATLRRHIAALIQAGLLFRRDSPNGKRFCRRDGYGQVEDAFGFDLAPLALRASEIHSRAEEVRALARRISKLRAEITLHLRDIAKTIEAAFHERRSGNWGDLQLSLQGLSGRIARNESEGSLGKRRDALLHLRKEVETAYLNSLSEQEMSGNDADFERHIQNSKTDQTSELYGQENIQERGTDKTAAPERKSAGITLKEFLASCPQMENYARDGLKTWRDVIATADLVRSMLGISPSAWDAAVRAMGEIAAAITVAAILERAEDIRSPGGYLRDLTNKAEKGRFSIHPMLKALKQR